MKFKYDRRYLSDRRTGRNILPSDGHPRNLVRRGEIDRRCHPDDQRQQMRYKVKSGLFVLFRKASWFKLLKSRKYYAASMIDISLKGVSAQYTALKMWPYDADTLSIDAADRNLGIDGIHYMLISDRKVSSAPNNVDIRRIGLKFFNLTDHHLMQITSLLQDYATHPIPYKPK